jgi:hypothetical protein
MFSRTKSQREVGPKKQSYDFQKDLRWVAWKDKVRIVKVDSRHFTKLKVVHFNYKYPILKVIPIDNKYSYCWKALISIYF